MMSHRLIYNFVLFVISYYKHFIFFLTKVISQVLIPQKQCDSNEQGILSQPRSAKDIYPLCAGCRK